MKKKIILLFILFLMPGVVLASEEYQNYFGITMTEEEYSNLYELGFTEEEIYYMSESEFNYNKDLNGNLEATSTRYFANIIRYDATGRIISNSDMEITEEDYNAEVVMPLSDGYTETTYKKMRTTIAANGSYYRYKVTLTWKIMPAVRSYDIIGIGCMSSAVYIVGNTQRFSQTYCIENSCTNTASYNTRSTGANGSGVNFKVPSSTSITSMQSFFYYDVYKNTNTVTYMLAYGDYAHATQTISEGASQGFWVNQVGIRLDDEISSYYDSIDSADAEWEGSW